MSPALGVIFLAVFLAADGLVALWGAGSRLLGHAGATPAVLLLTQGAFCLLLAAQVWLRTRQGRIWTMLYLGALVVAALVELHLRPALWADLELPGRLRLSGAVALRAGLIVWLWSWQARREFNL